MSLNGSGVMVINSTGQPAVAATLIDATVHNALTADLATAISTAIMKDGQTTVTADIPFNAHKLTGVAPATARTDAATLATIQDGTGVYVSTVGGTADAITLTASPAITAYVAGQRVQFLASGANTTAVTVAINGLAAKAITKNGATALIAGDIPSGSMVTITYDGTQFIMGTTGAATVPANASLKTPADNVFRVTGSADATKLVAFEVDGLTAGTTRTVTIPDRDLTIGPTLATEQATTSGTSIDFTGIPAGTRRITIMFVGVSTNGTNIPCVQLGDSGGIETNAYSGLTWNHTGAATISHSTFFHLFTATGYAANMAIYGHLTLTLENASTNTWVASGVIGTTGSFTGNTITGAKSTSAVLDRIRLTTNTGVDTFDAGAVNISYE